MESSNKLPLLQCEQILDLLETKPTEEERQALRLHLKQCADCRAELRLRAVMTRMAEEPPADLTNSIMTRIRDEKRKTAARLRFIRRMGAAAAAVVLIPAVVILAPILLRTGNSVVTDDALLKEETRAAETAPETAAPEFLIYTTDSDIPTEIPASGSSADSDNLSAEAEDVQNPPMFSAAPPVQSPAPETSPGTAPAATAEPIAPTAPPSYVTTKSTSAAERQTSPATMAADTAAAPQAEDPVYAVLRTLFGEKTISAHIAAFDGEEEDLLPYLCGALSVTRQDFVLQAQRMALSFTETELDRLFPDAAE
jgi:hypothetical protein